MVGSKKDQRGAIGDKTREVHGVEMVVEDNEGDKSNMDMRESKSRRWEMKDIAKY